MARDTHIRVGDLLQTGELRSGEPGAEGLHIVEPVESAASRDASRRGDDCRSDSAQADAPRNASDIELMTIGEVAREFGISLRALRFYESKRLIAPQRNGPMRLYRRSDRDRIALILTGRRLGFTLAEIKDLLDRPGGSGLKLTRRKCVEQINALEQQKRGIELALGELRQIYSSFYKARIADPHRC